MAWTAFETTLADLLKAPRLGSRFRDNLDAAVAGAALEPLDWSRGVWQRVAQLNDRRVAYVHRTAQATDLFTEVADADVAFGTIREALVDICQRQRRVPPAWIADDEDRGWVGRGSVRGVAYACYIRGGVDPNAPDTIRVTYTDENGEHVHGYEPGTESPEQLADRLFEVLRRPVSCIRVYRGNSLELERTYRMRGAP
jgi:hypothetical protein